MSRTSRLSPTALLGFALALGFACAGPRERAAGDEELAATSPDALEREVQVFVISTREEAGRLELVLELATRSREPLELEWAIEWLGRDGLPLPLARPSFARARLEPGARLPVTARAPVAGASSWRLRVAAPGAA